MPRYERSECKRFLQIAMEPPLLTCCIDSTCILVFLRSILSCGLSQKISELSIYSYHFLTLNHILPLSSILVLMLTAQSSSVSPSPSRERRSFRVTRPGAIRHSNNNYAWQRTKGSIYDKSTKINLTFSKLTQFAIRV